MKISEINIGTEITVKKIMTEELINLFSEISEDIRKGYVMEC